MATLEEQLQTLESKVCELHVELVRRTQCIERVVQRNEDNIRQLFAGRGGVNE